MAGKRMSIYAGAPIDAVMGALGEGYDENFSGRINTVCERYMAMVEDELSRIELSHPEWCAIMDANNGVIPWTGDFMLSATLMWANVEDSPELDEKWGIDRRELVHKMRSLSKCAQIAMREACDRFWSLHELPTHTALVKAGIRLGKPSVVEG
jgi:hypothetical protein